ncbi:uncharacterized protein LOC119123915 isoform X1 [Syngnathus acus]|uniref:uncharacterized protein LOC119123915 isoform X1 n=1 Tax=Syngnathus acus TaxID=161584 RepID=UPI001885DC74|nr:uncharacterized protein LOC119123915 isoform X1 [Syngnathus acus]
MADHRGVTFFVALMLLVCFTRTGVKAWYTHTRPTFSTGPVYFTDDPVPNKPLDPTHLELSSPPLIVPPLGQNAKNPGWTNAGQNPGGQNPTRNPGGQIPVRPVSPGQNPVQIPGGQDPFKPVSPGQNPVQIPGGQTSVNPIPPGPNPVIFGGQIPVNPVSPGRNPVEIPGHQNPVDPVSPGQNPVRIPGSQIHVRPVSPGQQPVQIPGGQNPGTYPGGQMPGNKPYIREYQQGQDPGMYPGGQMPENKPHNWESQQGQNPGMYPGGQLPENKPHNWESQQGQNPGMYPGGQMPVKKPHNWESQQGQNPVPNPVGPDPPRILTDQGPVRNDWIHMPGQIPGQNPSWQIPGQNPSWQIPGQNPFRLIPGQNPSGLIPGQNPSGQIPGQNPSGQIPGQNPSGQIPGRNPFRLIPGQNPSGQFPGQNPSGQFPGQNPSGQFPGQNPSGLIPGQNPSGLIPGRNPFRLIPGQNPSGQIPGQNPSGQFPGQNPSGQIPGQNPSGQFPGQNPSGQILGQNPSGQFPGQNPSGQIPGRNPSGQFPGQNPSGQFPGQNPSGQFPGQNPSGQIPGRNPSGQIPGRNPSGQIPGQNPSGQIPGQNPSGQIPGQNPSGGDPVNPQPFPIYYPIKGVFAFDQHQQTKNPTNPEPQHPTPVNICDVYPNTRVPCGPSDISATDCEVLNCCYNEGICYFGKMVTVQCTKDGQFIVVVARHATLPNIDLETISMLGDGPGCTSTDSNSAFAIYQFPVTTCGTVVAEEPGQIIYENRMTSSYEVAMGPMGAITRDSSYDLLFQCRYTTTSIETTSSIVTTVVEVLQLELPPISVSAMGPINVHLRLGKAKCIVKGCNEEDVAYNSYYMESDYPVTRILRDPVYVEVHLMDRTDPNIVLNLGRCWTTTNANPHSVPQWDLIIDGCPNRDDRYRSTLVPVGSHSGVDFPSHYRRFIFQMFTFVDPNSLEPQKEQVYIHCSTSICNAASGFPCEPNCFTRKRRNVKDVGKKLTESRIVVSAGPVQVVGPKE